MNKYKVNKADIPIVREALETLGIMLEAEIQRVEGADASLGEHSKLVIKRARVLHMHYDMEKYAVVEEE